MKNGDRKPLVSLEINGFPCVATWDGFHIHVGTKQKTFTVSRNDILYISIMGLIGYNKRFLDIQKYSKVL